MHSFFNRLCMRWTLQVSHCCPGHRGSTCDLALVLHDAASVTPAITLLRRDAMLPGGVLGDAVASSTFAMASCMSCATIFASCLTPVRSGAWTITMSRLSVTAKWTHTLRPRAVVHVSV